MPIFLMLGFGLTVITLLFIGSHVLLYGTKMQIMALFVAAWLLVLALWILQI